MAQAKHWLLQTPKELLDDFANKLEQRFVILRTNIYFFQGEHLLLLLHKRDSPAPGQAEEWTVPYELERIDRPESHPAQQVATTIPVHTRVLKTVARMGIGPATLREVQFMEFNKPSPLYLPDGDTLTIWVILTAYNDPFLPDTRAAFLTSLHPSAKFCWADRADLVTTIKTPASDTDKTSQLHILDIQNAFSRLDLCAKDALAFERKVPKDMQFVHKDEILPSISVACANLISSVIEARALTSQGNTFRHGMILLSTRDPAPHLAIRLLTPDQMDTKTWAPSYQMSSGEVYRAMGGFMRGRIKINPGVPFGDVMMENGRIRIKWVE